VKRRLILALGGAVFAASAVGGYVLLGGESGQNLRGSITVFPTTMSSSCEQLEGFTDITPGASVKITDGTGAVLGTTELRSGSKVGDGAGCRFGFDLGAVQEAPLVQISVGEHQGLTLTAEQLASTGRNVELRLGGVVAAG
jgi:hypothetical protein